ncbi:MAG: hypothetical protein A2428_07525 [Bdellovibrionales bacterium RIFOXYC1_FULL_54_43]|nr:MAG: hypothetical protein A2428_07525 [Bdellovibrionales bacterium RIFOXYC1_FULL_54_43]OFZ84039.1 MAG: hypothetical protein A2603_15765 [Bdellovibrionales bacterium RIFOXYD1_FULL_55_31]
MQRLLSELSWELSVLSRSVRYPNLSSAAAHVAVSQPQLSRIISRLERELGISLLDRGSRRNSSWTPLAFRMAECFMKSARNLESEIQHLIGKTQLSHVRIGSLEGLMPLAMSFVHHLLTNTTIKVAELDVHDLNHLEELFLKGELNLVFTSREPGKKKFKFSRVLGTQSLDKIEKSGEFKVLSSFEFGAGSLAEDTKQGAKPARMLVSNSLAVRKNWLSTYGGKGMLPSEVRRPRNASSSSEKIVFLLAADILPESLWKELTSFRF